MRSPQLLDSIGEVCSNMSSTDDVFVVSHAKQASDARRSDRDALAWT